MEKLRQKSQLTRRHVRTFQPKFAEAVEFGRKRQTVRKRPLRHIAAGDLLEARAWRGAPYRSTQRRLCVFKITRVANFSMSQLDGIRLDGESVDATQFAQEDGFHRFCEMIDWFGRVHGSSQFDGIAIFWDVADLCEICGRALPCDTAEEPELPFFRGSICARCLNSAVDRHEF